MMLGTEAESRLVAEVYAMVQNVSLRVQGTQVRMTRGKYEGRIAELAGAIIGNDGQINYLCYVQRADRSGPINGDCASRSYLPRDWFSEIDLTEED